MKKGGKGEAPSLTKSESEPFPALEKLFADVVRLIKQDPAGDNASVLASEDKLRLYGRYNYITRGACPPNAAPSILAIQATAKYRAWLACNDLTTEQAMIEYLKIVQSRIECFGESCRLLLKDVNIDHLTDENNELAQNEICQPGRGLSKMAKPSQSPKHITNQVPTVSTAKDGARKPLYNEKPAPPVSFLGIKRLVPRGRLDISFSDLAFAATSSATLQPTLVNYQHYESKINNSWEKATGRSSMVGLSVRTLLDLYLRCQQFPAGSEIIMTPPVSVPGMLRVLEHHRLKVVGVDLPEDLLVSVDCEGVRAVVTDRTVAIMVVHVFGAVTATDNDMRILREIADERKITLLEDCAEAFTGLSPDCYLGSSCSDLTFYSFGLIKTNTALGGGVITVANPDTLDSMRRLYSSIYDQQSNYVYFSKVLKALLMKAVSDSPWIYGLLAVVLEFLGFNFDRWVTSLLRGFAIPQSHGAKTHLATQLIRHRPSVPLLALLFRRLEQASLCLKTARSRSDCSELLIDFLGRTNINSVRIPRPPPQSVHTHWLLPLQVDYPSITSQKLRQVGFDATSGATQLCCVTSDDYVPRCARLMNSVLYVPNAIETDQALNMALSLVHESEAQNNEGTSVLYKRRIAVFLLIYTTWYWGAAPTRTMIFTLLRTMSLLACTIILLMVLLRRYCGHLYLDSKGFHKYLEIERQAGLIESGSEIVKLKSTSSSRFDNVAPSVDGQRKVILTGATGFIGSMLLCDLLRNRKSLNLETIFVICRPKKNKSAAQRISELLGKPMFSFLTKTDKDNYICVLDGDVQEKNAGLDRDVLVSLTSDLRVTHLFHCAASVGFTQSMANAFQSNVLPAIELQGLAGRMQKPCIFVHLSTAFVHGGLTGTEACPLPEELFSFGRYDPMAICESMTSTHHLASKAMFDLGFPNTYTFSKSLCEHILIRNDAKTIIIRPPIVGPAFRSPYEGWAGWKPSTLVAAATLFYRYQWNLWPYTNEKIPMIPVDVLTEFIIEKSFPASLDSEESSTETPSSAEGSYEKVSLRSGVETESEESISCSSDCYTRIFNATWMTTHLPEDFTWKQYAHAVFKIGVANCSFGCTSAYFTLFFTIFCLPRMSPLMFKRCHWLLVQLPHDLMQKVCKWLGYESPNMSRLNSLLDLPLLFLPFMSQSFHFESAVEPPNDFDFERYLFSCAREAKGFAFPKKKSQSDGRHYWRFYPLSGGTLDRHRWDGWWALMQPTGGVVIRVTAWLLAKVLRSAFAEVTINMESFAGLIEIARRDNGPCRVVLAPTHRSFFDFLLMSFVCFAIPEIGIQIPYIVAADDFENVPLIGWLAKRMGALFVRRGIGKADPTLERNLKEVEERTAGPGTFEVFIEGRRSRDRRFVEPKTGFLRCLRSFETERTLVIPVAISYEKLPEQETLSDELCGQKRSRPGLENTLRWIVNVFQDHVKLGKAHVSACEPLWADEWEVEDMVSEIQQRQEGAIIISKYHLAAVSSLTSVDYSTVRDAFETLQCKFWPDNDSSLEIERETNAELWTVALQTSPLLSFLLRTTDPGWSAWLSHVNRNFTDHSITVGGSCYVLQQALRKLLHSGDAAAEVCLKQLAASGFQNPSQLHVCQIAKHLAPDIPMPLMIASMSASGAVSPEEVRTDKETTDCVIQYSPILSSGERLGFWGYADSKFISNIDETGARYVTMEGKRYGLCGKRLYKLLPFIEDQLSVKLHAEALASPSRDPLSMTRTDQSEKIAGLLEAEFPYLNIDRIERLRHGTGHAQGDVMALRSGSDIRIPDAVVWPTTEAEVESIMVLAVEHSICLIPYGGGTNVSQATRCPPLEVEPRPIIAIDMRKMNRLISIDEENGLAVVEAGINGCELSQELSRRGYTMGHEPDSYEFSTVGGWVATKASGMKRSRYGNIEDIVTSVRVATTKGMLFHGDGSNISGRESCGIDLRSMILGSEGCLGIVTRATIRIWRLPEVEDHDCILLPTFELGLKFVRALYRSPCQLPASVRLLDNEHFRLGKALEPGNKSIIVNAWKTFVQKMIKVDADKVVCVTIRYEGWKEEIKRQKKEVRCLSSEYGGLALGSRAGSSGYALTSIIAYLRDFAISYNVLGESFETFAPWGKIEQIIASTKEAIRQEHKKLFLPGIPFIGCRVTQLYHEGVCIYFYFCMSIEGVASGSQVYSGIEDCARNAILANGGSLSHHHGVGKLRSHHLGDIQSTALRRCLLGLKKAVDPDNILGARNGPFALS